MKTLIRIAQFHVEWWGIRKEETMSETGIAAVVLMIFSVMIVVSYWRQIAIFLLLLVAAVFCCGVYYIVSVFSAGD